jgi:pyruvate/2-oxoglutarate dehydrogenase complex dihydrolipoamide acyltransferase (E2) component
MSRIAVIDFETTGISPGQGDRATEVAIVLLEHGQVVVRPIMYLALSYDHRLIDGREAVQFLVAIKQSLEDPARLLLGL